MEFTSRKYSPQKGARNFLDAANEILKESEVPYTLRGLFYELLERPEVWSITSKADWKKFKSSTATARKRGYRELKPWSLIDETRPLHEEGSGCRTDQVPEQFSETIKGFEPYVTHWDYQPIFGEVWTESRGAVAQVSEWIDGLTIRGMGGDSSIVQNWKSAERLTEAFERFGKMLVVFTIGDLDDKGELIPESALKMVREWCPYDIKHVRIGLLPEHVDRFGLPENIDGKGWQWEALSHARAKELITEAIEEYVNFEAVALIQERAESIAEELIADAVEKLGL